MTPPRTVTLPPIRPMEEAVPETRATALDRIRVTGVAATVPPLHP